MLLEKWRCERLDIVGYQLGWREPCVKRVLQSKVSTADATPLVAAGEGERCEAGRACAALQWQGSGRCLALTWSIASTSWASRRACAARQLPGDRQVKEPFHGKSRVGTGGGHCRVRAAAAPRRRDQAGHCRGCGSVCGEGAQYSSALMEHKKAALLRGAGRPGKAKEWWWFRRPAASAANAPVHRCRRSARRGRRRGWWPRRHRRCGGSCSRCS